MECKICHREYKALTNTHLAKHGITPKEYEMLFGCKTVPEDWVKGEKNPFYGKHHEEGKSKVKSDEYREAARLRYKGKKLKDILVNVSLEEHLKLRSDRFKGKNNPMYGKPRPEYLRRRISEKMSGSNNPNWKGGISLLRYPTRFRNFHFKESIRERENRKCFICGVHESELGRRLDVHHIDYDRFNLDKNNLVALCHSCHIQTNYGNRDFWRYFFSILIDLRYGNRQPSLSNEPHVVDRKVQRLTWYWSKDSLLGGMRYE